MSQTPLKIQMLTSGLLYQHYFEHIHYFAVTDITRETVDAAYEKVRELDTYYAENGLHVQYLYSLDQLRITPYAALKIQKSVALSPDNLTESIAIVASTFMSTIINKLIIPLINDGEAHEIRFFHTDAEAFAWFEERRKEIGF